MISNAYAGAVIAAAARTSRRPMAAGDRLGRGPRGRRDDLRPCPIVGAAAGAAVLVLPTARARSSSSPGRRARAARPDRHDSRVLPGHRRRRRPAARRHRPRGARRPGRPRGRIVGVAQRALDMAVEYAKEREQFGRPIGAYQAVSHRLADMLWEVEEARSLTYYAAWCADAEPDALPLAASMAKARASDAACRHPRRDPDAGGIGFTWEHDIHFFLKRARVGPADGLRRTAPRGRRGAGGDVAAPAAPSRRSSPAAR